MVEITIYPSAEKIVKFNLLVINTIRVKKADKAEVLSSVKIEEVLNNCRQKEGDLYDKAIVLMAGIIQNHPFASGNRRTAFIATKDFLLNNGGKFRIKDDPKYAKVMQGIREDYYSDDEIKEWIKNGRIREFRR